MLIQHFLHHWMRRHSHTLTHTHILYEFLRCIDRPKLKDGERKRKKAKQTNKNRIRHIKINCIIYFSVSFCRRFYFIVVQIHHTHTMPWMSASNAWKFVLTRTRLHTRKKLPQKMKHAKRRRRSSSLKKAHTIRYFIFYCLWVFLSIAVLYIYKHHAAIECVSFFHDDDEQLNWMWFCWQKWWSFLSSDSQWFWWFQVFDGK